MMKFVVRLDSSGVTPEVVLAAFKLKTKKIKDGRKKTDYEWLHSLLIKEHRYTWRLEEKPKDHALFISNIDI